MIIQNFFCQSLSSLLDFFFLHEGRDLAHFYVLTGLAQLTGNSIAEWLTLSCLENDDMDCNSGCSGS